MYLLLLRGVVKVCDCRGGGKGGEERVIFWRHFFGAKKKTLEKILTPKKETPLTGVPGPLGVGFPSRGACWSSRSAAPGSSAGTRLFVFCSQGPPHHGGRTGISAVPVQGRDNRMGGACFCFQVARRHTSHLVPVPPFCSLPTLLVYARLCPRSLYVVYTQALKFRDGSPTRCLARPLYLPRLTGQ